ncbi:hypothetical protein ACOSQ3_016101 [Xanthoceras sorbifolium]
MAAGRMRHIMIVVVVLMVGLCSVVSGQGMAPGPGPSSSEDCLTKLLNMSDCLSYVTEGSNLTAPEKPCCPELAGLVDSNPICLCELLGKSDSYGIKIDMSRALKLPSICHVTTPPPQLCSAVGVPVGGPTASEGGALSPQGLAANPSTGNNDNGASTTPATTVLPILAALAFAFLP